MILKTMSNIEDQFEAFLKEPLSTDDSVSREASLKHEVKVDPPPVERKFWWIKEKSTLSNESKDISANEKAPMAVAADQCDINDYSKSKSDGEVSIQQGSDTEYEKNQYKNEAKKSPDISSSMAEFLVKEDICKELSQISLAPEVLEYATGDLTDDGISSIMEQLSQLASSSGLSQDDDAMEKSVEEIMKEAEEIVMMSSPVFRNVSSGVDSIPVHAPSTRQEQAASYSGRSEQSLVSSQNKESIGGESSTSLQINKLSGLCAESASCPTTLQNKGRGSIVNLKDKVGGHLTDLQVKEDDSSISMRNKSASKSSSLQSKIVGSVPSMHKKGADSSTGLQSKRTGRLTNLQSKGATHFQTRGSGHSTILQRKKQSGIRPLEPPRSILQVKKVTGASHSGMNRKEKTTRHLSTTELKTTSDTSKSSILKSSTNYVKTQENLKDLSLESTPPERNNLTTEKDNLFTLNEDLTSAQIGNSASEHREMVPSTGEGTVSLPELDMSPGTVDVIYQLINEEVRNEIAQVMKEKKSSSNDDRHESCISYGLGDGILVRKPMSDISEESSAELSLDTPGTSSRRAGTLKDSTKVWNVNSNKATELVAVPVFATLRDTIIDSHTKTVNSTVCTLEKEFLEERKRSLELKGQLAAIEHIHKQQLDFVTLKHEEELFGLKKQMFVLNAKVADYEMQERSSEKENGGGDYGSAPGSAHRVSLLEAELQKQEQLILGFQHENQKLCQDVKQLK